MTEKFDTQGGHLDALFYGELTKAGEATIQKRTTAWEVFWYVGMHLSTAHTLPHDGPHAGGFREFVFSKPAFARFGEEEKHRVFQLLQAMAALHQFTPTLSRLKPPADFLCQSEELKTELEAARAPQSIGHKHSTTTIDSCTKGAPTAETAAVWLEVDEARVQPLLWALFAHLYAEMQRVQAYDERFELPVWGLCLVDVTCHLKEPCVMDLKVACYRVSHLTPQAKIDRVEKKDSGRLVREVGVRFTWMRRFAHACAAGAEGAGQRQRHHASLCRATETADKKFGHLIHTARQLGGVMQAFFATSEKMLLPDMVAPEGKEAWTAEEEEESEEEQRLRNARRRAAGARVSSLIHFFERTAEGRFLLENMAFVSSNVLFVYDAADDTAESIAKTSTVYFIDLAHSCPRRFNFAEEKLGFLKGLKNTHALLFDEALV